MDLPPYFSSLLLASLVSVCLSREALLNPYDAPDSCGLEEPGYICDPSSELTSENREALARTLSQFNNDNVCQQCIAVAVISRIGSDDLSKTQIRIQTKKMAKRLTDGEWTFENCDSLAVIVVNTKQRYVWFQPGPNARLCSQISDIFEQNKVHFSLDHFALGIEGMIATYMRGFNGVYSSSDDCGRDSYPCSKVTPRSLSWGELLRLLPSPEDDPTACHSPPDGFLCDPEEVLTTLDREDIADRLASVNQDPACGQCVLVALLDSASAPAATLQKLSIKLASENWAYSQCRAKMLILVAKEKGYTWLQGTSATMFCNELQTMYQHSKPYFLKGDVSGAVLFLIDLFTKTVQSSTDDCELDVCGQSKHWRETQKSTTKTLPKWAQTLLIVLGLVGGTLCCSGLIVLCLTKCCPGKWGGDGRGFYRPYGGHTTNVYESSGGGSGGGGTSSWGGGGSWGGSGGGGGSWNSGGGGGGGGSF